MQQALEWDLGGSLLSFVVGREAIPYHLLLWDSHCMMQLPCRDDNTPHKDLISR